MKTAFKTLGIVMLLGATTLFSSCEKDNVRKTSPVKTTTPEEPAKEDETKTVVVNATSNDALSDVMVFVNGTKLVDQLGLKEVTGALPIATGDAVIEVFSRDSDLIVSTNAFLIEDDVYNIVLTVGQDGITPELNVVGLNLSDFQGGEGDFTSGLGFTNDLLSTFDLNFLNLTELGDVENLLAGLEFLNADGDLVGGLLDLPLDELSGTLLGNNDILKSLDLLGSDLDLEELLAKLTEANGLLDVLNLGDVIGLGNISNGGILEGLTDLLDGLLGGMLGGGTESPLSLLDADILKDLNLLEGNDYTGILFGNNAGALDFLVIDQTELLKSLLPASN